MDSSTTNPVKKNKNIRRGLVGAACVAAIGFGALAMNPTTAYFSASDSGRVDIGAATLSIDLGDNKGSEDFDLDFTNLKPGEVQSQTFYVTNTGTISANVKVTGWTGDVNDVAPGFQLADYDELKIGVEGYLGLTPSTQFQTVNLGTLAPGQTRGYSFQVGLDANAGNEWQGAKVGGTVAVTLDQQ